MELLALLIAFVLGTLVGPFIWIVVVPDLLRRTTQRLEDAKRYRHEAAEVERSVLEALTDASHQRAIADERYADAMRINLEAQALIQKVIEDTNRTMKTHAIEEQKPAT